MAKKMANMAILEILTYYSDEQHPLSRDEILNLLKANYHIEIGRKTFYEHIDALKKLKYDISDFSTNRKGYYLLERSFEKSEINLLCHSIHSSHIIPARASRDLIGKLLKTQSKHMQREFHHHVYGKNYRKTENPQFFLNIDIILEAVHNRNPISFIYTKYNLEKEKIPRREQRYITNPYDIVYNNSCCYLIGYSEKRNDYTHYRIDKMEDIEMITEQKFIIKENFYAYDYAKTKTYMYGGKEYNVFIKCDISILDDVLNTFGINTFIQKHTDNTFFAKITTTKEGAIYWALQYCKYCCIIEPLEIKEEIKTILLKAIENY